MPPFCTSPCKAQKITPFFLIVFIGTFCDLSIIRRRGGRRKPSASALLGHQANLLQLHRYSDGEQPNELAAPLFHVAVHHTDVTVRDADILCRRVGILLGPFTDLDALNEQAKEFRGQLVDCPEALCLFDKGIYIRRRCFQLLLPLRSLSI